MEEIKKLYLTYPSKLGTISPEICGHFIEYLDGVFYDGLWGGKDMEAPRGIREPNTIWFKQANL